MVGRLGGLAALLIALIVAGTATASREAPAATAIPGCTFKPRALLTPGEGRPDPARSVAATGTLNVAMLFVAPAGIQPSESPQSVYAELVPPAQRWFARASYGRAQLQITALKTWLPVPDETVSSAVQAAASQLDLTQFDAVAVVLPEETKAFASHAEILPMGPVRYGVVLAPHPNAESERAPHLWTVLVHELGHVLGLPDLYAVAGNGAESLYVGPWDPMSQPLGQHLLAWHAWSLGWLDKTSVACVFTGASEATLTPLETPRGLKALLVPQGTQSVIVIEARKRIGLDAGLCAEGILAYTVQIDAVPKAAPIRVLGKSADDACGPLSNAPLQAGDTLRLGSTRIDVLPGLRVRVSR